MPALEVVANVLPIFGVRGIFVLPIVNSFMLLWVVSLPTRKFITLALTSPI